MKIIPTLFMLAIVSVFTTNVSAQSDYEKAKKEIVEAFGNVPGFLDAQPQNMLPEAWELFKSSSKKGNLIPAKYRELIKLGVAAQIPCDFCVFSSMTAAKAAGATDEELKEAVSHAAWVRFFSTTSNGAGIDLEQFKKDFQKIVEHKTNMSNN